MLKFFGEILLYPFQQVRAGWGFCDAFLSKWYAFALLFRLFLVGFSWWFSGLLLGDRVLVPWTGESLGLLDLRVLLEIPMPLWVLTSFLFQLLFMAWMLGTCIHQGYLLSKIFRSLVATLVWGGVLIAGLELWARWFFDGYSLFSVQGNSLVLQGWHNRNSFWPFSTGVAGLVWLVTWFLLYWRVSRYILLLGHRVLRFARGIGIFCVFVGHGVGFHLFGDFLIGDKVSIWDLVRAKRGAGEGLLLNRDQLPFEERLGVLPFDVQGIVHWMWDYSWQHGMVFGWSCLLGLLLYGFMHVYGAKVAGFLYHMAEQKDVFLDYGREVLNLGPSFRDDLGFRYGGVSSTNLTEEGQEALKILKENEDNSLFYQGWKFLFGERSIASYGPRRVRRKSVSAKGTVKKTSAKGSGGKKTGAKRPVGVKKEGVKPVKAKDSSDLKPGDDGKSGVEQEGGTEDKEVSMDTTVSDLSDRIRQADAERGYPDAFSETSFKSLQAGQQKKKNTEKEGEEDEEDDDGEGGTESSPAEPVQDEAKDVNPITRALNVMEASKQSSKAIVKNLPADSEPVTAEDLLVSEEDLAKEPRLVEPEVQEDVVSEPVLEEEPEAVAEEVLEETEVSEPEAEEDFAEPEDESPSPVFDADAVVSEPDIEEKDSDSEPVVEEESENSVIEEVLHSKGETSGRSREDLLSVPDEEEDDENEEGEDKDDEGEDDASVVWTVQPQGIPLAGHPVRDLLDEDSGVAAEPMEMQDEMTIPVRTESPWRPTPDSDSWQSEMPEEEGQSLDVGGLDAAVPSELGPVVWPAGMSESVIVEESEMETKSEVQVSEPPATSPDADLQEVYMAWIQPMSGQDAEDLTGSVLEKFPQANRWDCFAWRLWQLEWIERAFVSQQDAFIGTVLEGRVGGAPGRDWYRDFLSLCDSSGVSADLRPDITRKYGEMP